MRWYFAGLLLLAGCSSGGHGPKSDEAYENAMETGRSAFDLSHADQAVEQYRAAMKRALVRDDAGQIHDAGFNLATALLRQGKAGEALKVLDQGEAAIALRDGARPADLALVRSAALYRLHDLRDAREAAGVAMGSGDQAVRERGAYLRGLVAFDERRGDELARMVAVLAPSGGLDHEELVARLALLNGQFGSALEGGQRLVEARRDLGDYDGMRKALLLSAQAAEGAGQGGLAARLRQRADVSGSGGK